jgi:hypothetical protein
LIIFGLIILSSLSLSLLIFIMTFMSSSGHQMVDLEDPVLRRQPGKPPRVFTLTMGKIMLLLVGSTLLTLSLWGGMTSISGTQVQTRRRLGEEAETTVTIEFDEATYEGAVNLSQQPHGHGSYTWKESGDTYEGTWVNDQMAKAIFTCDVTGDRYEGEYRNGLKHGEGTYIWNNGDIFEGEYRNNKKVNGKFTWAATGNVYEGGFSNDLMHGQGTTFTWKKSGNVFEGEYKEGKQYNGVKWYPDGNPTYIVKGKKVKLLNNIRSMNAAIEESEFGMGRQKLDQTAKDLKKMAAGIPHEPSGEHQSEGKVVANVDRRLAETSAVSLDSLSWIAPALIACALFLALLCCYLFLKRQKQRADPELGAENLC